MKEPVKDEDIAKAVLLLLVDYNVALTKCEKENKELRKQLRGTKTKEALKLKPTKAIETGEPKTLKEMGL